MKKVLSVCCGTAIVLLLASCSGPLPVPEPRATLTVSFDLSVSRALTTISEDFQLVETGTVYLRQSGTVKYSQPITINKAAKSGSASFSAVVVGSYEVLVELHDSGSKLVYRGSAAADLHDGDNGTKSIPLERWIGSLNITGSWSDTISDLASASVQLSKSGTVLYGSSLLITEGTKSVSGSIQGIYPDTYDVYAAAKNSQGTILVEGSKTGVIIAKGSNSLNLGILPKTGSITIQIGGDLTSPVITSGPSATPNGADVTVAWTTDENATSEVCYSTTSNFDYRSSLLWAPAGGDASADRTSHGVSLSGLSGGLTYYYVVVSTDASGNRKVSAESSFTVPAYWARTYGGSGSDVGRTVTRCADGGLIVAGNTDSFGSGAGDAWIMRLSAGGGVLWQKTYGTPSKMEDMYAVKERSDGSFIAAGHSGGNSSSDLLILKLASNGLLEWRKMLGGSDIEDVTSLIQCADGGFAIAGYTRSLGAGAADPFLMKFDSTGNIVWQKVYGTSANETPRTLIETQDGNFIVSGWSENAPGWILKLSSTGSILWQKAYSNWNGTSRVGYFSGVDEWPDGTLVFAATSYKPFVGPSQPEIIKLDSLRNIIWHKSLSGISNCMGYGILRCADGSIACSGLIGGTGYDIWIAKITSSDESITWQKRYGSSGNDVISEFPMAESPDGGLVMTSYTDSYGSGGNDLWVVKTAPDGSCGSVSSTTAFTIQNSTCTVSDFNMITSDTNWTVSTPTITVTDTNCTVMQQTP